MVKCCSEPRTACLAILSIAVAVGGTGCGGATATKSQAERAKALASGARTRIVYVRPTRKNGSLKPGYTISARLDGGLCLLPGEVASGVADKCTVAHGELGPCWPIGKAAKARAVFCVRAPWEHSGTEIALKESLKVEPARPAPRLDKASIWGIELTSGQRCSPLRGAVGVFDGTPIDFACQGATLQLVGAPDRAHTLWTIREVVLHTKPNSYSYSHSAGPLGQVAVAWYGAGAAT
jgi:hypothetical protein